MSIEKLKAAISVLGDIPVSEKQSNAIKEHANLPTSKPESTAKLAQMFKKQIEEAEQK